MEHPEVPTNPAQTVRERMRRVRRRRGMTAQQLAAAMAANGVKWDRATVAKLESGHRQSISLEEWLTLAYVLNVAPLHLLVPLENDVPYSVSPRIAAPSERVRSWVAAHSPSLHAPTSDGHPGDANWLEWMEETPESGMERLLSPRELEAQVARLVEDRIAEVLARIDTSTGQDGDAR